MRKDHSASGFNRFSSFFISLYLVIPFASSAEEEWQISEKGLAADNLKVCMATALTLDPSHDLDSLKIECADEVTAFVQTFEAHREAEAQAMIAGAYQEYISASTL